MNPIWQQIIYDTVARVTRKCPRCKKLATYPKRRTAGQLYKCKHCGHRFREKAK